MQIEVAAVLKNLDGEILLDETDKPKPWTVGRVLISCLLAQGPKPYEPKEQIERYQTALDVNRALAQGIGAFVEVSAEMAAKLKEDCARGFGPIVGGQVIPLLDGK